MPESAPLPSVRSESPPLAARIGLLAGPIAALTVFFLLPGGDGGLSHAARACAGVATLMAVWWMTEALPLEATALLPLILRHAEFPLVFDQPEDDLDNRFIFNELVARIRDLKRTRQLEFVTHNANIPVLGNADRVIAMSMATARLAAPPTAGTIDEMRKPILDILEGGADAFRERRKRYKDIL